MSQKNKNIKTSKGKKTDADTAIKRGMVSRVGSLYGFFISTGILITLALVWVQLISPAVRHNAAILDKGVYDYETLIGHRGSILTRDGEPLAISSLHYYVEMDFGSEGILQAKSEVYYKNADALAKHLAAHFTPEDAEANKYKYISEEGYRKILRQQREEIRNRAYRLFPRTVTIDEWNLLRTYPILNGNLGNIDTIGGEVFLHQSENFSGKNVTLLNKILCGITGENNLCVLLYSGVHQSGNVVAADFTIKRCGIYLINIVIQSDKSIDLLNIRREGGKFNRHLLLLNAHRVKHLKVTLGVQTGFKNFVLCLTELGDYGNLTIGNLREEAPNIRLNQIDETNSQQNNNQYQSNKLTHIHLPTFQIFKQQLGINL